MPCPEFFTRICDELGENIDSPLCQELKEHVENCDDCRGCLESIRETVHLYQQMPMQQVPVEVTERLLKSLEDAC